MLDAIVLSDLHLGSSNCLVDRIQTLLSRIQHNEIPTARIILNGDIFDSMNLNRLREDHWHVLTMLRDLGREREVVWLAGNHDGCADRLSRLLNVRVGRTHVLCTGEEKILFLHGDAFDKFIRKHPFWTWVADCIYCGLQKIDSSHQLAKWAKQSSKTFLRCARKVEEGARAMARQLGCTMACCGHTHHPIANRDVAIPYFNSGCWTELPGSYLTIRNGEVDLCYFEESLSVEAPQRQSEPVLAISRAEQAPRELVPHV